MAKSKTPTRAANKEVKNLIEDLLKKLHTSEVPEDLPCRGEQINKIEKFLRSVISPNGESSAMYISGVPGTGKTATVQTVVRRLEDEVGPTFKAIYINAMELIDPKEFFVRVYKEITQDSKRVGITTARRHLNLLFQSIDRKRPPIIIMIDELDHMCTKRQELIYDIFNWTTNERARVTVIAIANTLDLPERMLSQRIASRLGSNRLTFEPYTHQQIQSIITARLSDTTAFDDQVVELAGRKVAAISGDLRKAIEILRRAAELALDAKASRVSLEHVQSSIAETQSSIRMGYFQSLSEHGIELFRAATTQVMTTGVEEFRFYELFKHYLSFCAGQGLDGNELIAREIICTLSSMRLIIVAATTAHSHNWWHRKMQLGVPLQEALDFLKSYKNPDSP
ncbi:unnamed protein product, partial [Mesorhabditis belari]|uniref:Origin recognition complex subunit 1 n=1 Tax=Mesorhabditis belari TaxID=2138241 RepID=A0AAF3E9V1_9BILA